MDSTTMASAAVGAAASLCLTYASVYACGALYLVPSAWSWRRLWRNRFSDATAVRLYALLGTGSLLRAVMFLLVAAWMFLLVRSQSLKLKQAQMLHLSYLQLVVLWQLLGMATAAVLGGAILLIFNTWASMVEQVDQQPSSSRRGASRDQSSTPSSPPRRLFIQMAVAVALLQLGAFLFLQPAPDSNVRRSLFLAATGVLACCWLAGVVLLPAYGHRMCSLLAKVAEDADHRQRNVRRIAAIATVVCAMRAVSLVLLAGAQYDGGIGDISTGSGSGASSGSGSGSAFSSSSSSSSLAAAPVDHHQYRIPVRDIVDANPAFFFSSPLGAETDNVWLRWVVLLEVVEFPLEWALLMALLCVLPAKSVLPSIRGYQPIPDKKWHA